MISEISLDNSDKSLKNIFRHKYLNEEEQKNFIEKYREIERSKPIFNFVRRSRFNMWLWLMYIISFCAFAQWRNININIYLNIVVFIFGIISLQIVFVATHIGGHALFLEYENHVPDSRIYSGVNTSVNSEGSKSDRLPKYEVYYYAFYHHHHTKLNNWAPFLSYYNQAGANNIAVAHWTSFSMLADIRILLVMILSYISPLTLIYYSGYEVGVIILPFAHRWQHIDKSEQNILIKSIFCLLELFGIVANKADHVKHHIHNGPTVYQDFSSSGIYTKYIDKLINRFWDTMYYKAVKNGGYLYDYIGPYTWLITRFMLVVLPSLLCLH